MSTVPLSEAKTHLNVTVDTHDAELQGLLDAAESTIAQRCGRLGSTPTTERVPGGDDLLLVARPAVSLVSVTSADGAVLDLSSLYLDSSAGIVSMSSGASFPARYYTVVFNAGRSSLPADLRLAVLELTRHFWVTQRGGSRRPGSPAGDSYSNTLPGAGASLPFRVEQLIAPHVQIGFA